MVFSGSVARVRAIDQDELQVYLELSNGSIVTVPIEDADEFSVGSVVLVRLEKQEIGDPLIVAAPESLWPEDSWVGVVRLVLNEKTVVDASGRWRLVPTPSAIELREGNTIEVGGDGTVVCVLNEEPIKYLDPPTIDDSVISKFKVDMDTIRETFDDFGGLQDVVERAQELIQVPLNRKKELSEIGARPIKGGLFTGPPGTGKTMLAKIIAKNAGAEFYEISGPQVFSKWYGESEEILRKVFKHAAKQERAIIFFDEIDSVAGQRAEESHEASRRVVAQLLTSMDGFTADNNVMVIAATNRPQDIDDALRRPERFDWELRFPRPGRQDREEILQKASRRLSTDGPLSHTVIADRTDSWSAAELAAIWSEAALFAASAGRSAIRDEDYVGGFERVSGQRRRADTSSSTGGGA